jgi:transposase
MDNTIYDHYIAIDWSIKNMAIARMTKKTSKVVVIDNPSNIAELQFYLKSLKGTKILLIEETTTSQWLYTELREFVDRLIICDPHRNKLLEEGPKTDKKDAEKLVRLLKSGLIKEVYHSANEFLYLRKLVSGYEDLVKAGTRLKNQRYSLLRACGKNGDEKKGVTVGFHCEQYALESLDRQIDAYEKEREGYKEEFRKLSKKYPQIRHQMSLPGIDIINGVKIVSRVVSPRRFANKSHYLSYAGLIKLDKISGGRSYGKKNPRYSRQLKSVYKSAAIAAIGGNNPINDYYEYLKREEGYSEHLARNTACRRLAVLSLGVFKSGKKYQPKRREKLLVTI